MKELDGGSCRILLVEDCEEFRMLTVSFLQQKFPFELTLASSGTEAIQILSRRADFDLIIADYQMPNGDGKDILDHIDRLQIEVPVIIFSGGGYEDSLFKHPKFFYKVDKPSFEKLEVAIRSAINASSEEDPEGS